MSGGSTRGVVGRQVDAVRTHGMRAVADKTRRHALPLLGRVLCVVPAAIAVLVMRLLRPVALIRTGRLFAWRIGHHVGNTEVYLCRRDDGEEPSALDLFSHWGPVANRQVRRMWDRVLHTSWFYGEMHWVNTLLPGSAPHVVATDRGEALFDWTGATTRHGVHLSFTDDEMREGRRLLAELIGDADAPYACMHARDPVYLRERTLYADTSYNDHRDSDVSTFIDAARLLTARGYHVLRMGAAVGDPLADTGDPHVVDYTTTARSDFMDVFLEAGCKLHFGDSAGLNEVPRAFRRPVVSVNYIPIFHTGLHALAPNAIFIPKRIYSEELGRCWTFREFAATDVPENEWSDAATYPRLGLTLLDSTPAEIAAVVAEMDDRIAGTWVETEEDRELQAAFWAAIDDDAHEVLGARIGAAFLREHRDLLA